MIAVSALAQQISTQQIYMQQVFLPQLRACAPNFIARALPDDDTARDWAQQELAKRKYHKQETLLQRIFTWIKEHLDFNITKFSDASTADVLTIFLILLLLGIAIFLLVRFIRSRKRRARADAPQSAMVLFDDNRSSDKLFAAAEQAAAANNYSLAVIELFRGVIRLLDEHGTILVRPGLTATEAALQAAQALGNEQAFSLGAQWFNRVYFANEPGTQTAVCHLNELADAVRSSLAAHTSESSSKQTASQQPSSMQHRIPQPMGGEQQ